MSRRLDALPTSPTPAASALARSAEAGTPQSGVRQNQPAAQSANPHPRQSLQAMGGPSHPSLSRGEVPWSHLSLDCARSEMGSVILVLRRGEVVSFGARDTGADQPAAVFRHAPTLLHHLSVAGLAYSLTSRQSLSGAFPVPATPGR